PVSRNSTSTPGRALAARSTSTASCMFDATIMRSSNVSAAQASTSCAPACGPSSRAPRSAIARRSTSVAMLTGRPPGLRYRSSSARRSAGRRRSTRPRARPRTGAGPRPRSRGSRTGRLVHSLEVGLLGPHDPLREPLALAALRHEPAHDALDVVAQLGAGDLQAAQLAPEPGVEAEAAAEVHLEALDLVAVGVGDDLALEPDVGHLGARAGVRAAVEVDGDRDLGAHVGQALLQVLDQADRPLLGLDDRELAELDARAGHRGAPPRRRVDLPAEARQLRGQRLDVLVGDVAHHDLLLRREPDPLRPRGLR